MTRIDIAVMVDLNEKTVQAALTVPVTLSELLQSAGAATATILGWLPDLAVDSLGLLFDGNSSSFGVYATAGIAGSAEPSAALLVGSTEVPSPPGSAWAVGMGLTSALNLGGVPLFGSVLSGISVSDLAISYASQTIPAGALMLPPPASSPPSFPPGPALSFTLSSAEGAQSFTITPSLFSGFDGGGSSPADSPLPRALAAAAAPSPGALPIQWFDIEKTFGPLTLNRIGAITTQSTFGLALDAGIATSVLSVGLQGFTLQLQKNDISIEGLSIGLQGLTLSLDTGTLSISGGLVKSVTSAGTEYNGGVTIQIGAYGIDAIGSFASINGAPSLFIFGMAEGQFGGPPAFFITGIAVGFGYNRGLNLPQPSQVAEFPLVAFAQNPGLIPGGDLQSALTQLSAGGWIPPSIGSYWVAAGLQFTSFQVVSSFALLTVQFGSNLVIALLGTSTVQLPTPGDSTSTYAYAEMMLDAVLQPDQGTFQATGLLTPSSYVLDQNCRLTGGFAAYSWFGSNANAGDFVVTIGGYNPYFVPPPWYPAVPRLGFDWQVSPQIQVTGDAYFAVTPSCGMAGGGLSVTFNSGPFSAWFTAYADFLVYWRPFYFVAAIGVSIGASYDLNLVFTHKVITVSLSAAVQLFGPTRNPQNPQSVAGVAKVSWWVISFTVNINGGGTPSVPGSSLNDWSTFATTFLPPDSPPSPPSTLSPLFSFAASTSPASPITAQQTTTICKARAASGLLGTFQGESGTSWLINADAFQLLTESIIPATTALLGPSGSPATTKAVTGSPIGVYPLAMTATATHLVELFDADTNTPVDLSAWNCQGTYSKAPLALWGENNNGDPELGSNGTNVISGALTGLIAGPPDPPLTGPPSFQIDVLQEPLPQRSMPLSQTAAVDGASDVSGDAYTVIAQTIQSSPISAQRQSIVDNLAGAGLTTGISGDLSLLASNVTSVFQSPPMLGPVGSTGPQSIISPLMPRARPGGQRRAAKPPALPPPLRLHGAIRQTRCRNGTRASAHLTDRFAPNRERLFAYSFLVPRPGSRAAMRIPAGTTLLWDLAADTRVSLFADGRLALRVSVLGDNAMVLDHLLLAAGDERGYVVPAGTRRVALTALDPADAAARSTSGWSGTSRLLQAAPRAYLTGDAIVRPQSPLRLRTAYTSRDSGVTTGRDVVRRNLTQRGIETIHGAIETHLPASARRIVIPLRRDSTSWLDPVVDIRAFRAAREVPLSRQSLTFTRDGAQLSCVAAPGADRLRVVVRAEPGWLQDGLIGLDSDDESAPLPALYHAPAGPQRGMTEVAFV